MTPAAEDYALATFARQMRVRRLALNLTQEEVAARVGLTRASVANIESIRQDTSLTRAAAIAAALGTTLREML